MYLLSLFNLRFSPFSSGHSLVKGNGVMCLVESAVVLTWYSVSSWFKKQTKKFILPTSLSPIGSVVGAGGLVGFRFRLVCWLVCFGRGSGIGGGVGSLLRPPRHCFVLFCFTACLFLLLEVRWISLGSVVWPIHYEEQMEPNLNSGRERLLEKTITAEGAALL